MIYEYLYDSRTALELIFKAVLLAMFWPLKMAGTLLAVADSFFVALSKNNGKKALVKVFIFLVMFACMAIGTNYANEFKDMFNLAKYFEFAFGILALNICLCVVARLKPADKFNDLIEYVTDFSALPQFFAFFVAVTLALQHAM